MIAIVVFGLLFIFIAMAIAVIPMFYLASTWALSIVMRGYTGDDFQRRLWMGVGVSLLLDVPLVIASQVVPYELRSDQFFDIVPMVVNQAIAPLIISHWIGVGLYFWLVWRWTQAADRYAVRTDVNALFNLSSAAAPRKRKTHDEAATDAPPNVELPTVRTVLMRYLFYACIGTGFVTGLLIAAFSVESGSAYVATLIFFTLLYGFFAGVLTFLLLAITLPSLRLAMRGYDGENEYPTQVKLVIYGVIVDAALAFLFMVLARGSSGETAWVAGTFLGLTALVHNAGVALYYLRVRQWAQGKPTVQDTAA